VKKIRIIISLCLIVCFCSFYLEKIHPNEIDETNFICHVLNPKSHTIRFYWQNDIGENIKSIGRLKEWLQKRNEVLVFAMNGGMYKKDLSPLGLYVENGKVLVKINSTKTAHGNFYLQPNGIFYLTKDYNAIVCKTTDFVFNDNVKYATQSGPMLLIDGEIHTKFTEGSKYINIRNGVGILSNGDMFFAMSKKKVNFYDFASYFKQMGCKNALYLDGFVSKTYLPEIGCEQLDGTFGVLIGETKRLK